MDTDSEDDNQNAKSPKAKISHYDSKISKSE